MYSGLMENTKARCCCFGLPKEDRPMLPLEILELAPSTPERLLTLNFEWVDCPEKLLMYSGRPHISTIYKNHPDVTQKYFNAKSYFQEQTQSHQYSLPLSSLLNSFNPQETLKSHQAVFEEYMQILSPFQSVVEAFN
jgi:hypothetical protein